MDRRPRVLSLPSATTLRLIVLIVAMLAAGLFVGTALYNSFSAAQWIRDVAGCANGVPATSLLSSAVAELRCGAPGESQRVFIAVASTAVIALAAVAIVLLAPTVLRRRRRLRPGVQFTAATARLATLAHEAGVAAPQLIVGPVTQRDAFCFGRPGRYTVALPIALVLKPHLPVFDVVVRHEIAHIAHRDVALSWLARSVWYALAPALVLPLVLFVAAGNFGLGFDYLWRAVVFAVVVLLIQRAVLRSREYDADLRVSYTPGAGSALLGVLAGLRATKGSWARRMFALHPDREQRRAAVEEPERVSWVGVVDGLSVGFLTGLVFPLVDSISSAAVTGNPNALAAQGAGALLIGPLLGATLGVGLWRQALLARVSGNRARVIKVALGVLVGSVLGQIVSLANTGLGTVSGDVHPVFALIFAVAASGTTLLVAGLGELWAGAAGRIRRPAGISIPAAGLSALLFAGICWAADILQRTWDQQGWTATSVQLATPLLSIPMAVLIVTTAIAVAWALRSSPPTAPGWLCPHPTAIPPLNPRLRRALLVGLLGGLAGGLVLIIYRLLAGPAVEDAEIMRRLAAYPWIAAAAGAAVLVGLSLLRGREGLGAGLLAGPVAAVVVMVSFFVLSLALGGSVDPGFAFGLMCTAVALELLLSVPAALITLGANTGLSGAGKQASVALLFVVTVLLASAGAGATVLGRNVLAHSQDEAIAASIAVLSRGHADELLYLYRQVETPPLIDAYNQAARAWNAIVNDQAATPAVRAQRLRTEAIGPLNQSLASAQAFHSPEPAVNQLHQLAIVAIQDSIAAYDTTAQGLDTNSPALQQLGQAKLDAAEKEWSTWHDAAAALPR